MPQVIYYCDQAQVFSLYDDALHKALDLVRKHRKPTKIDTDQRCAEQSRGAERGGSGGEERRCEQRRGCSRRRRRGRAGGGGHAEDADDDGYAHGYDDAEEDKHT